MDLKAHSCEDAYLGRHRFNRASNPIAINAETKSCTSQSALFQIHQIYALQPFPTVALRLFPWLPHPRPVSLPSHLEHGPFRPLQAAPSCLTITINSAQQDHKGTISPGHHRYPPRQSHILHPPPARPPPNPSPLLFSSFPALHRILSLVEQIHPPVHPLQLIQLHRLIGRMTSKQQHIPRLHHQGKPHKQQRVHT